MNSLQKYLAASLLATAALLGSTATALAAPVSLGAASDFSVLGASVTCTTSVIAGDVGISPATAFTNTGCTIAGGMPPATNAAAVDARADFLSAYAAFQLQSVSCTPLLGNLAGLDLIPGTYCIDAVAKAGTLTLTGAADGVWVFLVDGALTGTNFSVLMAGGGQPCNVFWVPSTAATMTDSTLKGSILAGDATLGSITLTRGTLAGSALANIAVSMTDTNVIGCDVLSGSKSCKGNKHHGHRHTHDKCNQGVGNGSEGCDPGDSNHQHGSNDEYDGKPGYPGRKGDDH